MTSQAAYKDRNFIAVIGDEVCKMNVIFSLFLFAYLFSKKKFEFGKKIKFEFDNKKKT